MTEIILDERAWCENILSKFDMGASPVTTLNRLAKYYHSIGCKKNEISRKLEEFILRCNPSANMMRWQEVVDTCVKHADKRPLIHIDSIDINKSELDQISLLSGQMAQKLAFTLLCIAKYRNAVSPKNDSWVNMDSRDVFRMANAQTTRVRQYTMMNDLLLAGYVNMNHIVDNVSMRVTFIDNCSDVAMRITDFRNLGNQYLNYYHGGYVECAHCGLVIKRSGRNQKYCKACSDMKRATNTRRLNCAA